MKINGKYTISKRKRKKWEREALEWSRAYHDGEDPILESGIDEEIIVREMLHEQQQLREKKRSKTFPLFSGPKQNAAKKKVKMKMKIYRDKHRLTKLHPEFLGYRRAENPKRIPPNIIQFWDTVDNALPPITRHKEVGVRRRKRKTKPSQAMCGKTISEAPHYKRWDWGGGLSANEFELAKDVRVSSKPGSSRLSSSEIKLPAEMENTLKQYIDRNLGEGIWEDEVASRLAKPLDASVFLSSNYRENMLGSGARFVPDVKDMYKFPSGLNTEFGALKNLSRGSSNLYAPSLGMSVASLSIHSRGGSNQQSRGSVYSRDALLTPSSSRGSMNLPPCSIRAMSAEMRNRAKTPPLIPRNHHPIMIQRRAGTASSIVRNTRGMSKDSLQCEEKITLENDPYRSIKGSHKRPRTTPGILSFGSNVRNHGITSIPQDQSAQVAATKIQKIFRGYIVRIRKPLLESPANNNENNEINGLMLTDFFAAKSAHKRSGNKATKSTTDDSKRRAGSRGGRRLNSRQWSRQSMGSVQEDSAMEPQTRDIEIEVGSPLGNNLFDNKHWPLSETNQGIGDGHNNISTGYLGLPRGVSRTKMT